MKRLRLVAVASLMFALAGCGLIQEAGAGVTVGDDRMTSDEIAAQYQSIYDALDGQMTTSHTDTNRQIISSFVFSKLVDRVTANFNIVVTDAEVQSRRDILAKNAGGEAALINSAATSAVAPEMINRTIRMGMLFEQLVNRYGGKDKPGAETKAYDKLRQMASAIGVNVSQRYGTFDVSQLLVSDAANSYSITSDQLSQLLAQNQ